MKLYLSTFHQPEHLTLSQAFSVTSEQSVNNKSPPCFSAQLYRTHPNNNKQPRMWQGHNCFHFFWFLPLMLWVHWQNQLKVLGQQHQTCSTMAALGRLHSFKLRRYIMQLKCTLFLPATHTKTGWSLASALLSLAAKKLLWLLIIKLCHQTVIFDILQKSGGIKNCLFSGKL